MGVPAAKCGAVAAAVAVLSVVEISARDGMQLLHQLDSHVRHSLYRHHHHHQLLARATQVEDWSKLAVEALVCVMHHLG